MILKRTLQHGRELDPAVLGSMLRLGKKYDIADLENSALECLHHEFPTSLSEWDSLERGDDLDLNHRRLGIRSNPGDIVDIISIAHEFHLFTILPAAYGQYLQIWEIVVFSAHTSFFFC
jgi:hypothetical protein